MKKLIYIIIILLIVLFTPTIQYEVQKDGYSVIETKSIAAYLIEVHNERTNQQTRE
jgi:uncharacterized protein (UPF0333 family)